MEVKILGFGRVWEGFWHGLGRVWEGIWRFLGALKPIFGVVFLRLYLGWFSKGLLEASGLDFGSILGGFEWIMGGFWRIF